MSAGMFSFILFIAMGFVVYYGIKKFRKRNKFVPPPQDTTPRPGKPRPPRDPDDPRDPGKPGSNPPAL